MNSNTQFTSSSSFRKTAVLLSCWLIMALLAIPAAQPVAAVVPTKTVSGAPQAAKPVMPVATGSVVSLNVPAAITATCVVTNTNNTGVGSLKDQLALGNGVCDRITFDPLLAGKTITVTGEINIAATRIVEIDGSNALGISLSGNNANRIFNINTTNTNPNTAKLTVYNLTLRNGKPTTGNGGAILNNGSTVVISNTRFLNNSAPTGFGGALRNQRVGSINSTLGTMLIYNSYFEGNQALNGGAITTSNGSTIIENSAFVNNRATGTTANQGAGGAIQSLNQANPTPILTTYITNTTIANNYARNGAAIFNDNNGRISVAHSTIANNVVDSGIQNLSQGAAIINVRTSTTASDEPKLFNLSHTIVANTVVTGTSAVALDFAKTATAPAFSSLGYNLIETPSITAPFIGNTVTNIIGVDPALAPLANNGGSTPTFALISGSPAINAGDPSFAGVLATDQRGAGFPRVVGGRIDIGAFEGSVSDTAQTGTLVVNTTNDSDDGVCGTIFCSLREAITFANSTPTSDTITFNIGGTGTRTISPITPLPAITAPVVLDATTQPGASCNAPTVEVNGSLAGAGANGFTVNTSNSTIKGFVINNFSANGIALNGASNTVACNWIGLNSTGTADAGNTLDGVAVKGDQAMLMDNTISGNNRYGVYVNVPAAPVGSMIKSNFIGTNAAGTTGISNTVGIFVDATPRTMIGGTTAADGNVISGNGEQGIVIRNTGATNNVVQSNLIGTNAGGTVGVPNNDGIYIFDVANTSVLSNTIAGNKRDGIVVGGGGTSGTQIKGNFIGTTANNATTIGNFSNGIVLDGTNGVVIGGIGAGNVIAGNGNNGIDLRSSFVHNTTIKGNFIGVAANGTTSIPNQLNGIRAANSNTTNLSMIGGTTVGEGNTIAFNKQNGVVVVNAAVDYSIIGNSIFSNTGLGIDLAGDGVTANDAGDGDTGANSLQNFPVLTTVNANVATTQIQGNLNSTASSNFTLHFYSSADCDPSNHGEGQNYLGSTSVTTNASGTASFNVTLPTGTAAGQKVTATATNSTGSTSEFSQCFTVGNLPTLSVGNVSVNEGDSGTTNANFVLTLSAVSTSDVVVQYATSDGTATNPEDYIATTGTITITAGQTTATISVPVNGDLKDEADETFFLNLTDATNASINNGQAQATISDDDDAPTMSIADASVVEGNSGMTTMVFTVTLSNPSSTPISVTYTTQNGTATAADYTPISGTLTFAANETSKVIEVMVLGDVLIEGNETFTVELSGASVVLADATATGTIIDNDVPTISIADVSINEGNTGTVTMVFTVTLSESSSQTVTVNYATANDTATAGSDYVAASGTLTFAPGETSKTISVTVNGDTAVEGDETFFVNLSNAVNATLADSQAIGTIVEGQEQFKIYLPLILKNG